MNDRFSSHGGRAADRDKQGLPMSPAAEADEELFLEDTNVVASTMECTGLMPTPPASEGEAEAYADLYPVPEVGGKGSKGGKGGKRSKIDNGLQKKEGVNAPQTP